MTAAIAGVEKGSAIQLWGKNYKLGCEWVVRSERKRQETASDCGVGRRLARVCKYKAAWRVLWARGRKTWEPGSREGSYAEKLVRAGVWLGESMGVYIYKQIRSTSLEQMQLTWAREDRDH